MPFYGLSHYTPGWRYQPPGPAGVGSHSALQPVANTRQALPFGTICYVVPGELRGSQTLMRSLGLSDTDVGEALGDFICLLKRSGITRQLDEDTFTRTQRMCEGKWYNIVFEDKKHKPQTWREYTQARNLREIQTGELTDLNISVFFDLFLPIYFYAVNAGLEIDTLLDDRILGPCLRNLFHRLGQYLAWPISAEAKRKIASDNPHQLYRQVDYHPRLAESAKDMIKGRSMGYATLLNELCSLSN